MKKCWVTLFLLALMLGLPAYGATREDVMDRLNDAAIDLSRLTEAPDKGIPNSILADAKCVAVVPSLVKGGFIFGAQHGRGVATCRVGRHWSSPAFFSITGGSWGAQIGVQGTDLVMLFMTDEGARKLLNANLKLGADASAAAGPWGRDVSANTNWKLNTGILTYSRARGVFIGATLNGASVRADYDAIRLFYGRMYTFRDLLQGRVPPPEDSRPFLRGVRHAFHEAQEDESPQNGTAPEGSRGQS
jgi:lipid-binding SYLF domain-containing protein